MDNQGAFLSGGTQSFGIQQASVISDATADLIFGGGTPSTDPSQVAPIKKEPKKKQVVQPIQNDDDDDDLDPNVHVNRVAPPAPQTFSPDDILDAPLEDDDDAAEPAPNAKPKPNEPSEAEPTDNDDTESTFEDIAKELVKLGIFKERDADSTKPLKTGEDFRDRFLQEKQDAVNEGIYNFIMSKHGEEGIEMFDAVFVKGIPIKDFAEKYSEIQSMENLDLSVEDNQKKIYREAYRRQGLSEDKIEKKLQRAIDYGDLAEEATDLHEIVLKQEREDMNFKLAQAQEVEANKRAQKQEYLNNLNQIFGAKLKEREFDGIPVTDKVARDTYDYMTSEKWVLPSGEKLTDFDKDILELRDPKNHEMKVKLALLLKQKLDLSKIKQKAITNDSNRVFDSLVKREAQVRRTQKVIPTSKSFLENL
jgi:hypothetical protein